MHPTTSPPIPGPDCSPDGYTPMITNDKLSSPLPELPTDLEPPPVNRDLKPRRKSRPPPLDLRNLSTIREHATLTRMWTVPYNRTSFISPDRDGINSARIFANSVSGEEEESYIQMEHSQATSPCSGAFPWSRKSNLDYLALDFNSASPSPVQKKPFLSEEQRVDYVQVDEQKTQALQNTKQEWTDVRQSKVFALMELECVVVSTPTDVHHIEFLLSVAVHIITFSVQLLLMFSPWCEDFLPHNTAAPLTGIC
uniref:GRB2 associated binding protein 3 n=1 Tax=Terrapene triunguis TaxID=2587831 RepID=A0A674JEA2_9SAUR